MEFDAITRLCWIGTCSWEAEFGYVCADLTDRQQFLYICITHNVPTNIHLCISIYTYRNAYKGFKEITMLHSVD